MVFKPEPLLPAGDMEKFQAAAPYGADAAYLGGSSGNLRASSKGFSRGELRAWLVGVRGRWEAASPVELMLPGQRRPVLEPGSYALENHRGGMAGAVNSGTRAVLFTANQDIMPGIFFRGRNPLEIF